MALAAEKIPANPEAEQASATNMADWFEVYYQDQPANTPVGPVEPELTALEQMYAYY